MSTLNPSLTAATPNPNVAYNNAWIPVENQSRPLFAQATYLANASDLSLSLSASELNVNLEDIENLITSSNILLSNSNTLLNDLTGKTVSVNTSALEVLLQDSNTLLNDLTGKDAVTVTLETSALTVFGVSSSNPAFVYQGDLNYTTDSVSVSVLNISVDLLNANFGKNGFSFITPDNNIVSGDFVKVQVVSACKFTSLSADNSEINSLIDFEFPVDFSLNAPITEIALEYGAVIAYKA
jgi:hypothetical protein